MTTTITPGLLVLHGNRAELLGEAVFEWLRRQPLDPLEEEIFLVQSNGVAEWLKMTLAEASGICAATRVELPGRFLWRSYRQLLGREAVPAQSRLDKLPLTWGLMRLLPELMERPGFEPLAGFLRLGGMERRLQLASALADLFDQYQVYRSDWLAAWGAGQDVLPRSLDEDARSAQALPPDQAWQAALWRELQAPLSETERASSRPQLHQRFVAALQDGQAPHGARESPLARRVILFGMTHVPMQTLQALAALSEHCQVVLAIPNPCRYHWADIMDGRELLRAERRRQPLRQGLDLATLSLEEMHAHAHPLLASWGRQGRDFVRQLDVFDDVLQAQERFQVSKVDLFDEAPGKSLLAQVQAHIRDLTPLAEHPRPALAPDDYSIVFHIAHSAQREVEILHDQLLTLLAQAGGSITPRDIVVMVPDIEAFAPAIRSVFGQFGFGARSSDKRFIPYDIADLKERANNPLLVALEWLLRLPQQRCRLSELQALLEVPAIAARFGLDLDDLPRLNQWMEGAGIRWGLGAEQRAEMGLGACGEQNSLVFGLRRILLGYGSGEGPAFQGIQPYAEVGGLSAGLAGSLADLAAALDAWWQLIAEGATPAVWAERCRALLADFFSASSEADSLVLAAAAAGLNAWLEVCALAGFEEAIELAVVREAWLESLDAPTLNRRFKAGGVTFCSLMPMRAVPFEVVCLLGMNDGDYPRRASRSDFDLMGLPGLARPGDRSRRDDDRQLMLEALLSARAKLYISWSGRSVRDNSEQPPSVLVSQLRDYLQAGWHKDVLQRLSTEHPLQPFSRRYFEATQPGLFTHAREWRDAHVQLQTADGLEPAPPADERAESPSPLNVSSLAAFLKNPVKAFFKQRLLVQFDSQALAAEDDEAFAVAGLLEYSMLRNLLDELLVGLNTEQDLPERVAAYTARLRRAGNLPMAEQGLRVERKLVATLTPMLQAWLALQTLYPLAAPKDLLRFPFDATEEATEDGAAVFEDWLADVRCQELGGQRVWIELTSSRLCLNEKTQAVQPERLLEAWVRLLAASACGVTLRGVLVGKDATVTLEPLPHDQAQALLSDLLLAWSEGMHGGMNGANAPLPLALSTGLALLSGKGDAALVYEGGFRSDGEGEEPCLARLFPDFAALSADGRFEVLARRLYEPFQQWVKSCAKLELHQAANLLEAAQA
ncbi:exodeoxyribonuclease V subunit gamma [Paucibacter sp. TC2R-5]|uniref:exodeoxyribonuclease V subunit gamma n=1 Tax=Paucibacter sp. TC2R-5 TaxID=2893555 RepID=UPI0021E38C69|nr:exodeoxyribonuclease V subunit gamma [Paucibacter sp. TC2R-5]MCV2359703.1 exodeoxyribonuclease V subunit gamma [Paucibacter sp. TC2R-5]